MLSFEQSIQTLKDLTLPSGLRRAAVANLAEQAETEAVPFLTDALADADSTVRREAAKALQQLNATASLEPLLHALKTESNDLTAWAMMEAVAELGTRSVLPTLQLFQNVDSLLTRLEANKCVARIEERFPEVTPGTNITDDLSAHRSETTTGQETFAEESPEPANLPTQVKTNVPEDTQDVKESTATKEPTTTSVDDVLSVSSPSETDSTVSGEGHLQESPENSEEGNEVEFTETEPLDIDTPIDVSAEQTDEELSEDILTETETLDDVPTAEDAELEKSSASISQSPRLAGQTTNLPVLAPSSPAVWYSPMGAYSPIAEQPRPNLFALLLRPDTYFSKRWVSRTRTYIVLWCVLVGITIGAILYQGHDGSDTRGMSQLGFIVGDPSAEVKRSLAAGDFYIQEGYYRQAIDSYELSRHLGPIPIHYYKKLGFAYLMENQYALAVKAYEFFLAAHANETHDPFEAQASMRTSRYPDYKTYNALGTAYMKLGRLSDAQRVYEKALAMTPEDGQAYNNLARLYVNGYRQKLLLAEALAYKAVLLNPDVAAYHDTLGWIQSQRGQTNRAINTLERVIRLQSDYIEAHYHLALVAMKANKRKKAIKAIQTVLKLDPAFVHLNFQS